MIVSRGRALFALSVALQGCVLAALAFIARSGGLPSTATLCLAVSFIPYASALAFARSVPSQRALDLLAVALPLGFGAALLFAPPLFSDDLYRYLWEGRLWLEGFNPYTVAPDAPGVVHLRDELWSSINNKPLATIYPPVSQLVFVVAQWLGGDVWTLKLLALLLHGFSVAVVARLHVAPTAALAIGLNPLLIGEAALNGHFDILCGVCLLVAAWAISRQRFTRAAIAACAAVGLKVVGLVVLPLLAKRPRVFIAAGIGSALLLAPLAWWRAPVDPVSGAGQFAMRWRGNESVLGVLEYLSRALFEPGLAELVARGAVAMALLGLCVAVVHRRLPALTALRALVWAVLILSPQVHPWYLAWLLPLEVAAGGKAGFVWSAAVLLAYAPLDRWLAEGVWDMPLGLQILEYSVLALALIADPRRPTLSRGAPEGRFPL